ncbi:MAG: MotA/TolQ/ExbB proton channel family protein [Myxococcota bacterium]
MSLYHAGGVTLVAILAMSVIALGIGIERGVAFRSFRLRMEQAADRISEALAKGEITKAQAINTTSPIHPATEVFEAVLTTEPMSVGRIRRLERSITRRARAGVWVIGTIAATAPFVGLFGTVRGVMEAFGQIGAQGGGGFEVVSGGISEALITTAGGILVGIEAMFLFNYLQARGAIVISEMRDTVEELKEAMEARRGPDHAD